MKYYLLDENKNLVEGFDKEGFLALLEQAIENGSLEDIDEDSAVASKIRSVLNGTTHHIEFVTQAQYNQLVADEELVANTYYFITDDTTEEDLENHLTQLDEEIIEINENNILNYKKAKGNDITAFDPDDTFQYAYNYFLANENKETDVYEIRCKQSETHWLCFKFIRGSFPNTNGAKSMLAFVTEHYSAQDSFANYLYLIQTNDGTTFNKKVLASEEELNNGTIIPLRATNAENAEKTSFTNEEWQSGEIDNNKTITISTSELAGVNFLIFKLYGDRDNGVYKNFGIVEIPKSNNYKSWSALSPIRYSSGNYPSYIMIEKTSTSYEISLHRQDGGSALLASPATLYYKKIK